LILDSSAFVAVVFREPGCEELEQKIEAVDRVAIGAPTLVLIGTLGETARPSIARLRERLDIVVVPFTDRHWEVAADVFARFGKGHHPACLNYGDCMTYATARLAERPLLFIGNDFAQTDIEAA
jgi:ribonuclease VapC